MHHTALEKLCTLAGVFSEADGGRCATILGTYQPPKLGRRDRTPGNPVETLLLSRYLTMSRFGYLDQGFRILGYLKAHPRKKLGFDPEHPAMVPEVLLDVVL